MHEEEIRQMEEAAEQQDWESMQQALRSLICKIKHETVLKLLLSYVQVFMNDFLSINPQHKLKYDELKMSEYIQIYSKYLESVTSILEQHKGEPGVNNFRRAISSTLR